MPADEHEVVAAGGGTSHIQGSPKGKFALLNPNQPAITFDGYFYSSVIGTRVDDDCFQRHPIDLLSGDSVEQLRQVPRLIVGAYDDGDRHGRIECPGINDEAEPAAYAGKSVRFPRDRPCSARTCRNASVRLRRHQAPRHLKGIYYRHVADDAAAVPEEIAFVDWQERNVDRANGRQPLEQRIVNAGIARKIVASARVLDDVSDEAP